MSQCECNSQIQDPQSSTHITHVGCSVQKSGLDPWHYTGSKLYHSDSIGASFIKLCKEKLPNTQLPIKIGWTGYINYSEELLAMTNAWCFDELGRVVILLNGEIIFQRYTEGDLLMKSTKKGAFTQVTHDNIVQFSKLLQ